MPLAPRPFRSLWFLAAIVVLLRGAATPAAAPRDELLRFVPDDVGFCFILQDFRDHLKALSASPFSEQLDKSPLGKLLATASEMKQLADLEKQLKILTGLSADELRDDILGDAVVFAFRPAPPGKADEDQGLVLLRARSAEKLQTLIAHINDAQKKTGQLTKLEECEHHGVKYFRRTEAKETNYYYARGALFAFTGQEAILKDALDHNRGLAADAEPVLTRRLRESGLPHSLFTAWINPRAFDDLLAARAKEATAAPDAAFFKQFAAYWKALDGVVVAFSADKELSLTLALQGRLDALPSAARLLFGEAAKPSELMAAFPDNALLATSGRLDLPALVEMLGDFMTKENRETFQQQLSFTGLLPKNYLKDVGPDVGLVVMAPAAEEKSWVPHAAFAVRVAPGADPDPTDAAIVSALTAFAKVTAYTYNQQHPKETVDLTKVQQGKRTVHTLVGDKAFPPGVQPSLTLAGGYLLLADSPTTIRQLGDALAKPAKAPAAGAFPLLRLSLKDWRSYLKDRRDPLVQAMVEQDKLTKTEAEERLDNLLGVLQFADRLEVSQRSVAGRTTLTIAIQTAYPLKK